MAAMLEVAEDIGVDIYTEVRERVRQRLKIQAGGTPWLARLVTPTTKQRYPGFTEVPWWSRRPARTHRWPRKNRRVSGPRAVAVVR